MDVSELWAVTEGHPMPLSDKEAVFRALIHFRKAEEIDGAAPEDLTEALDAVCKALEHDENLLPDGMFEFILDGATRRAVDGPGTYGDGVRLVRRDTTRWHTQFLAVLDDIAAHTVE